MTTNLLIKCNCCLHIPVCQIVNRVVLVSLFCIGYSSNAQAIKPGGKSWMDSYSVAGQCYCDTTFDHNIATVVVDTPAGPRTVREVCEAIGPGPGSKGNPIYNDVQCGNGPANDRADEVQCPGRVDSGEAGCFIIGPKWNLDGIFVDSGPEPQPAAEPPKDVAKEPPTESPSESPTEADSTKDPASHSQSKSSISNN